MAFPSSPTNGQQTVVNGVTYTYSTALTAWTVTSSGGSLTSASALSVTGNITGGNLLGSALSVSGNITGGNLSGTNIVGTVTTAAQTNITSVGTLVNTQITSLGVGTAASGTTGEIRATNNITAYFSDQRLKETLGNIPDAINKVMNLSGVIFVNNDTARKFGYNNDAPQVGVIAQEVERELPEAVTLAPFDSQYDAEGKLYSISGNRYLTVYYDRLIPLLIEAIKQQQKDIEELKKKIG